MKFTRFISFFLIFILFSQSAFSLGKKDKDSDTSENTSSKEEKIPPQQVKNVKRWEIKNVIVQNEHTPVGEYRNEVGHRKFDSKKPPTSMD